MLDRCRTLVIEDDTLICKVLSRQLERFGVPAPTVVHDGTGARELIRGGDAFDLIFCDLRLPGIDGVELLRDIADLKNPVGVVLMSGLDEKVLRVAGELARARQLWLLGTIAKPIAASALSQVLNELEKGHRSPGARQSAVVGVEDLRAALKAGEIQIHVQPKVEVSNGRLKGVEALARWDSPTHGPIFPDTFIPMATSNDLIDELTDQVMAQSVHQCSRWRAQGLDLAISVNVSVASLDRLNLPERITDLLAEQNLEPSSLVLEITESGMLSNLPQTLDVVTRLRMRGIELSIDDFGTGYSTLGQLRQIPFNELKIDRAFVAPAVREPEARSIVESNIRLARDLGMRTVAEGVECARDWTLLNDLGCDQIQGYFVAKPMPADELFGWEKEIYVPRLRSGELPPA